jgi:serine/threonine protein kinase
MVRRMQSEKPSFWRRLGLGSAPGDAEQSRAFLQQRIALYLGGVSLMWLSITVTGYLSAVLFMPSLLTHPGSERAGLLHNGGTLLLIVCWLACRRGRRSRTALSWLDAGTTVAQACVMSLLMGDVDIGFRPDMSMAMGVSCALIGRAAVVPSHSTRTAAIGVLSGIPILVATLLTHLSTEPGSRAMTPPVVTSQVGMWLAFAVFLSSTISQVIYGLSKQVREAARLGQYTLERKIGEGGMGVVYLARHALLRRPTAIKLLAPGRTGEQALERFEREVQATSMLRHPNTVAIYDYGRTPDGVFYYAMEYLDGIDLEYLIEHESPLPEGRVVYILIQVANALSEAHRAGLIHRDIKPSNVLLCDHGDQPDFAKVLDFGLVKELSSASAASSTADALTGTPLYMSPESIMAPATLDARSDLYALGAVAYALLTGGPPFTGNSALAVCGQHVHSAVVAPSTRRVEPLTQALEDVVLACLAKDREQRPVNAAELAERLRGCGVAPWTTSDARAWWKLRGNDLRHSLSTSSSVSPALANTVAVDLAARAAHIG